MSNVVGFKQTTPFDTHLANIEKDIDCPRVLREFLPVLESFPITLTEVRRNTVDAFNSGSSEVIPVRIAYYTVGLFKHLDKEFELFDLNVVHNKNKERTDVVEIVDQDYRVLVLTMIRAQTLSYVPDLDNLFIKIINYFDFLFSQGFFYVKDISPDNLTMVKGDIKINIKFNYEHINKAVPYIVALMNYELIEGEI